MSQIEEEQMLLEVVQWKASRRMGGGWDGAVSDLE